MSGPYREPHPRAPEAPEEKHDPDPEITTSEGHRTRALHVEDDELLRGAERELEITELLRCESCAGDGCDVCADAGATVKRSTVRVSWPANTTDATVITFAGRGDVPGLRRDRPTPKLRGERGDLLVRLGTKAKVVRSIERADKRRRIRQKRWLEERAAVRSGTRARGKRALLGLAVIVLGLGGLFFVGWLRKGQLGDDCTGPKDCRSGLCVESTGFVLGKGGFTEKKCSAKCTGDADCRGGSVCKSIEQVDAYGVPMGSNVMACTHR